MKLLTTGRQKRWVEEGVGIGWIESLAFERDTALSSTLEGCVDETGAGNISVELKRQEGAFTFAAPFLSRFAHQRQHVLKLQLAQRFIAVNILGQLGCGFANRDGLTAA